MNVSLMFVFSGNFLFETGLLSLSEYSERLDNILACVRYVSAIRSLIAYFMVRFQG